MNVAAQPHAGGKMACIVPLYNGPPMKTCLVLGFFGKGALVFSTGGGRRIFGIVDNLLDFPPPLAALWEDVLITWKCGRPKLTGSFWLKRGMLGYIVEKKFFSSEIRNINRAPIFSRFAIVPVRRGGRVRAHFFDRAESRIIWDVCFAFLGTKCERFYRTVFRFDV